MDGKPVFPRKILIILTIFSLCLIPCAVSAQLNATFTGTGAGESIYSRYYSNYINARVFNMDIGGQNYEGYCIDLFTTIRVGDTVLVNGPLSEDIRDQVDWCAVNYILHNYGDRNGPGSLTNKNTEAAAVQAAIWYLVTEPLGGNGPPGQYHFMNDTTTTTPYDAYRTSANIPRDAVRNRAIDLLTAARPGGKGSCTFLFPVNITLTPSMSNISPSGSVDITATVYDQNNNPLPGIGVTFVNAGPGGGALNISSGTTDANGNLVVRFTAPGDTNFTAIDAYVTGDYGTLLFDPGMNRQSITTITLVPYSIADRAEVFWTEKPSIRLDKLISTDNQSWIHADLIPIEILQGSPVYYKLVITNDGNTSLNYITLQDSILTTCIPPSQLNPAETFECYLGPFSATPGINCNTARAVATSSGIVLEDTDSACYNGMPASTKSGRVFTNISGTITGIDGVTVWICKDCSDSFPVATVNITRTNATGYYLVEDLPPGNYNVSIPRYTADAADRNENLFSTYLPLLGGPVHSINFTQEPSYVVVRQFSVPPDSLGNDFEFRERPNATITGYKFFDYNRNGRKDGNGFYLPNWTITLRFANGTFIGETQTDDYGHYSFTNLDPYYTYNVSEELKPGGWFNTSLASYLVSFLSNPYGGANEFPTTETELEARMSNFPYDESYIWLGYNVRIGMSPNQEEWKIFEPLGDWSPGAPSNGLSAGGDRNWISGQNVLFNATWDPTFPNANLSVGGVNDIQSVDIDPARARLNARPLRDLVIRLHSENPNWYIAVDNLTLKQGSIEYTLVNKSFNWSGSIKQGEQDLYYVVLASNILTGLPGGQDIEDGFSISGDIRFTWPSGDDNQVKGNVLKMDIMVGRFQSSYDSVETAIFGNHINGTVSGYKRDEAGAGLAGWNITCTNTTLEFYGNNVTNDSGYYLIRNVPPGWFQLNESLDEHPGWEPVPPDVNRTIFTNLTVLNLFDQNFTNRLGGIGSIDGYKRNSTTLQGLNGWNITLTNYTIGTPAFFNITYPDPVKGAGYYNFTNVPFGLYWLNETNQSGFMADPPGSWSRVVEINSTTNFLVNQNFTNQPLGSIYGSKTVQGTGGIVSGWKIDLINRSTLQVINTTFTNSLGNYNFTNIPWGLYYVNETIRDGYFASNPLTGSRSITIGPTSLNVTSTTLTQFTNRVNATISGYKLESPSLQGLSGWTITLKNSTSVIATTTTNDTGYYIFPNLTWYSTTNTFYVVETPQDCYANLTPTNQSTTISQSAVTRVINFTNFREPAGLNITKIADTAGPVHAGQLVTYTITVCNTGNLTLDNIQVFDNRTGPYTISGTLGKNECNTTTRIYTVTDQDICNGSVTNYVFSIGTDPCGKEIVTSPNATITLPASDIAGLNITKTADTTGPVYAGQLVTYTITVCNTGNLTLNNLFVMDNRTGNYTLAGTLAKNQCNITQRTYQVTDQDVCNGSVTNYAYATAQDPCGGSVVTNPNATVFLPASDTASLNITKTADTSGPVGVSDVITYTITVCNTGNLTLNSIQVVDNRTGTHSLNGTLAKNECYTISRAYTVTGQDVCNGSVINYAYASAVDFCGNPVMTSPNATVSIPTLASGTISGIKFNDLDGNGNQGPNDNPLSNWTIRLYQNGVLIASTLTGSNGAYTFSGLPCGIYTVDEVIQPGWNQTAPPNGSYTVEINGTALNVTGRNFGNREESIKCCCPTRAYFTFSPSYPVKNQTISFMDQSNGCPVEWNWSFGDGTYSNLKNPTHSYANPGTYSVTEYIRACGCSGTIYWTSYTRPITISNPLPPTVSSIYPASGYTGTTVAITNLGGTNFRPGATVMLQKTGQPDIGATNVVVVTANKITCQFDIPGGAATGTWDVVVTNSDATTGKRAGAFTISIPPPPTVSSIYPASGYTGTTVAITNLGGTNFRPGATVMLQKTGQPDIGATNVVVVTANKITCQFDIPGGAATGTWDVVVTNSDGTTGKRAGAFTISIPPPPTVSSIYPASGYTGTTVTITSLGGTNFRPGATVMLQKTGQPDIGATNVVVVTANKITCQFDIPVGAAIGYWDIVVTNSDLSTGKRTSGFYVR
jgi:hypothetical protein